MSVHFSFDPDKTEKNVATMAESVIPEEHMDSSATE